MLAAGLFRFEAAGVRAGPTTDGASFQPPLAFLSGGGGHWIRSTRRRGNNRSWLRLLLEMRRLRQRTLRMVWRVRVILWNVGRLLLLGRGRMGQPLEPPVDMTDRQKVAARELVELIGGYWSRLCTRRQWRGLMIERSICGDYRRF